MYMNIGVQKPIAKWKFLKYLHFTSYKMCECESLNSYGAVSRGLVHIQCSGVQQAFKFWQMAVELATLLGIC